MAKISASTILAKAKSYVGTKESPANSNNVIFNTDYYGKPVSGSAYPWCCVFLWDIFRMCGASNLFYGGKKCAYTPTLANYYKSLGAFYSTPKVGDIVFYQFAGSNRICHVGLVLEVLGNNRIKTVEGNTSSSSDANGGAVEIRERTTTYVKGYGRPAYDKEDGGVVTETKTDTTYSKVNFIKDVQKAIGVTVDGVAGPKTIGATPTVSKSKNSKHAVVKPIQKYLNSLGFNCGTVDGDFGPKTDAAVKKYQTWMKNPDGELTAKGKTWRKLLGME